MHPVWLKAILENVQHLFKYQSWKQGDHFQDRCSLVPRKFIVLGTVWEESETLQEVSNTVEQTASE